MAIDISIRKQFINTGTNADNTGEFYVGNYYSTAPTTDLTNYYTKTQLQAGVLDDLYINEVVGAYGQMLFTKGNGDASTRAGYSITDGAGFDTINLGLTGDSGTKIQLVGAGIIESGYASNLNVRGGDGGATGGNLILLGGDGTTKGNVNIGVSNTTYIGLYAPVQLLADVSLATGSKIYADDLESKVEFVSGWTGDGWELTKNSDDEYDLEVDNLRVRGQMNVYELILNKIRATNGSLWVSDAVECIAPNGVDGSTNKRSGLYWDAANDTNYFLVEAGMNTLMTNDMIRSQQFLGNNIHQYDWKVTDSSGTYIAVEEGDVNVYPETGTYSWFTWIGTNVTVVNGAGGSNLTFQTGTSYVDSSVFVPGKGRMNFGSSATALSAATTFRVSIMNAATDTAIDQGTFAKSSGGGWNEINQVSFVCDIDTSVYVRISTDESATQAVTSFKGYIYSYSLDSNLDVTGFTFVRMGNTTDEDRQGALYLTASDTNAPYLEVLDEMTSHTIGNTNRKVRLGKLNGLSWEGDPISSYGLWTEDAYLSGYVNAVAGNIGAWNIEGDSITGIDGSLSINLDAGDQIITFATEDGVAIEIKNQSVTTLANILAASQVEYTGSYLTTYSDASTTVTSPDTTHVDTFRYQKYSNPLYLGVDQSGTPSAAERFDMDPGTYYCNLWINVDVSYNLPDSSIMKYDGTPIEPPTALGQTTYTNVYTINGGWRADSEAVFFDPATKATFNEITGLGYWGGNLSNWKVVNNKYVTVDASSYIRLAIDIDSTFQVTKTFQVWNAAVYGGFHYYWEQAFRTDTPQNVNVDFTFTPSKFLLDGTYQKTEIGKDGLNIYRDTGTPRYMLFNPYNNAADLMVAGSVDVNLQTTGTFKLHDTAYDAAGTGRGLSIETDQNYQLVVEHHQTNNSLPAVYIQDGNASGSNTMSAMWIRTGNSSGGYPIRFYTYNGTDVGEITHNGTNITYGTTSDARRKDNIRDISINACNFLMDVSVREWEWKDTSIYDVGFVAQEALEYYPRMVQIPDDTSTSGYGVGSHHLIPFLVKAIQELTAANEYQANVINDLQDRITILEG